MKPEECAPCLALLLVSWLVATAAAQDEAAARRPTIPPIVEKMGDEPTTTQEATFPRVVFEIGRGEEDWGRIVVELDVKKAPLTVRNFLGYVDEGFYDGTIFHRVMSNFMIQGGGQVSLTEVKKDGLHPPIGNEAKNGLKNLRYTIAMARAGEPHSARAQFFINVKDNPGLDPDCPEGDGWGYCVFGKVVEGMAVVDRIKDVKTGPHPVLSDENSQPIDPPMIRKAYRLDPHRAAQPPPGTMPTRPEPRPKPPPEPKPETQPGTEPEREPEHPPRPEPKPGPER